MSKWLIWLYMSYILFFDLYKSLFFFSDLMIKSLLIHIINYFYFYFACWPAFFLLLFFIIIINTVIWNFFCFVFSKRISSHILCWLNYFRVLIFHENEKLKKILWRHLLSWQLVIMIFFTLKRWRHNIIYVLNNSKMLYLTCDFLFHAHRFLYARSKFKN